jgi:hypothetical protein
MLFARDGILVAVALAGLAQSSSLTPSGVLAHIAAGGGWDTAITLINTSSTSVSVSVVFRADDGSVLSLPLAITQGGTVQSMTASTVNAAVSPNTTMSIGTGAMGSTIAGWAEVLSSGPIDGFAIMRFTPTDSGDKSSEATVPLQAQFPSVVTLAYDNTAGYVMGVALVNLGSGSASVNATVWNSVGTQLGVQQISIAGNGHTSFVLTDKLPKLSGQRGMIQFQNASGGIAGLGLRFSPSGTFTDIPVVLQQQPEVLRQQ